jgi:succinate dehydrogenase / fumarate reductase membrane anchor subunit
MVTNITSLTGNGLKDWLIQRFSAVYFAFYSLFLLGFIVFHPHLNFQNWSSLFSCGMFKVASIIALFMLSLHAWIGLWTVTTDYIKCTIVRLSLQMIIFTFLLAQFVWGVMIVWGR